MRTIGLMFCIPVFAAATPAAPLEAPAPLQVREIATARFGADAAWYEANTPFFECSDRQIEDTYYYRWRLYKAHIRDVGAKGFVITEFLNEVSWDRKPYSSLNDATPFHLNEGRWLADKTYVQGYITYLHDHGGNDRHFSEGIADAVWGNYLVDRNRPFLIRQLPAMIRDFRGWVDHYDRDQGLYYIEPLKDATEYSIASIDASGGKDGFRGGEVFRPSMNSYMFGNARAISRTAEIAGDAATSAAYAAEAQRIRERVLTRLWHPDFQHFVDCFKANNEFVKYGTLIRGRELVGYVPWAYELPEDNATYAASWRHLMDPSKFRGACGLRTVEPTYEHYMRQHRYEKASGRPECEWNGPSWPYQTTQVLLAMANLLNDYHQAVVTAADYIAVLRDYAAQHRHDDGFDLQEDYNPDTGDVIVGLQRSHHYNHSGFCDLVITGLCGLRPRPDNVLEVNPLVAGTDIRHFCLDRVLYHGHRITVLYDDDGTSYGRGAGLSVFADGTRLSGPGKLGRVRVNLPDSTAGSIARMTNVAVSLRADAYPKVTASFEHAPDVARQACDGRVWYFPELTNRWSTTGSPNPTDWLQVEFDGPRDVSSVSVYPLGSDLGFATPRNVEVQCWDGETWVTPSRQRRSPAVLASGCENRIDFPVIHTTKVRVVVAHASAAAASALAEVEVR